MTRLSAPVLLMIVVVGLPAAQGPVERLDYEAIGRIRDEGLQRSQVMDHIGWLADVYGPRLTGGPGMAQGAGWTLKKFAEWDLASPHRQTWSFGRGWSLERFSAHMIEPQVQRIIGLAGAWSPARTAPSSPR